MVNTGICHDKRRIVHRRPSQKARTDFSEKYMQNCHGVYFLVGSLCVMESASWKKRMEKRAEGICRRAGASVVFVHDSGVISDSSVFAENSRK